MFIGSVPGAHHDGQNYGKLTLSFFFLSGVMKPFFFLAMDCSSIRLRTSAFLRSRSDCLLKSQTFYSHIPNNNNKNENNEGYFGSIIEYNCIWYLV